MTLRPEQKLTIRAKSPRALDTACYRIGDGIVGLAWGRSGRRSGLPSPCFSVMLTSPAKTIARSRGPGTRGPVPPGGLVIRGPAGLANVEGFP